MIGSNSLHQQKNVLKHIQNQDPWSSRGYKTLASYTTEKQHVTSNKTTALGVRTTYKIQCCTRNWNLARRNTFFPNITKLPVPFLSGISNTANGLNIFGRKTLLIIEHEQSSRCTSVCYISRCNDKLKWRIHLFQVFVIFSILCKENSPWNQRIVNYAYYIRWK